MTSVADLRFVDPTSLTGEMQIRNILAQNNTSTPVIDWVMETVRDLNARSLGLEKELHRALMDQEQ